jgi:hypothetical protein
MANAWQQIGENVTSMKKRKPEVHTYYILFWFMLEPDPLTEKITSNRELTDREIDMIMQREYCGAVSFWHKINAVPKGIEYSIMTLN